METLVNGMLILLIEQPLFGDFLTALWKKSVSIP